jgi:hypothetical protein
MSAFSAYYQNVHNLNPFVRQHLPSIEWLVSTKQEARGTGRTSALLFAYLRDSFSGLGPVTIRDHHIPRRGMHDVAMDNLIQRISSMGVDISSDGEMAAQPAVPASLGHPQNKDALAEIMRDFRSICASAVRMGVSPVWMLDQVKSVLAASVMFT